MGDLDIYRAHTKGVVRRHPSQEGSQKDSRDRFREGSKKGS